MTTNRYKKNSTIFYFFLGCLFDTLGKPSKWFWLLPPTCGLTLRASKFDGNSQLQVRTSYFWEGPMCNPIHPFPQFTEIYILFGLLNSNDMILCFKIFSFFWFDGQGCLGGSGQHTRTSINSLSDSVKCRSFPSGLGDSQEISFLQPDPKNRIMACQL